MVRIAEGGETSLVCETVGFTVVACQLVFMSKPKNHEFC